MAKKLTSYQKQKLKIKELYEDINNLRGKNGLEAQMSTELRYKYHEDMSDMYWMGDVMPENFPIGFIQTEGPEMSPEDLERLKEELEAAEPIFVDCTTASAGKVKWTSTGTDIEE